MKKYLIVNIKNYDLSFSDIHAEFDTIEEAYRKQKEMERNHENLTMVCSRKQLEKITQKPYKL